ncbi:hypothetical protein C1H46_038944 [Malus baccata]|uniref:Uncharacterized protein n=1 Tax=Malus baccata TaxID=106549 RepID=A0A540KMT4_MALBA|nr:hypothetical protein C1H46_038944 [Malus baccata]
MVMVLFLKHLRNTMTATEKSATKLEQHGRDDSYKTVLQSMLQWQRKLKCYTITLRKPAATTQAISCTARQRHRQKKTVIKGTTQQIPAVVSITAPHGKGTTEGKL